MKVFEIIFILLLLIPIALLMRYFVTRLSAEAPKQAYTRQDVREGGPAPVAWLRRRHRELDEEAYTGRKKKKRKKKPQTKAEETADQGGNQPDAAPVRDPDFVPREHAQMRRTERVPFSQTYHDGSTQRPQQRSPEQRPPQRREPRPQPGPEKPAQWPPKQPARRLADRSTQKISVNPEDQDNILSAEERLQQRREAAAASARKKQPRSEQSPSKRQKRNNRRRARKRELNRRDKDNG